MVFPFMATFFTAVLSATLALAMPSAAAYAPVTTVLVCAWLGCIGIGALLPKPQEAVPPSQADYEEHGLGPLMTDAPPARLYLDLMKRVILNLCYHEQSHQVVLARSADEGRAAPELAGHFSLRARVLGEDVSLATLSMIGLRRLDSLQACISALVAEGIPGEPARGWMRKGRRVHLHARRAESARRHLPDRLLLRHLRRTTAPALAPARGARASPLYCDRLARVPAAPLRAPLAVRPAHAPAALLPCGH
jgi:hypothetical protein